MKKASLLFGCLCWVFFAQGQTTFMKYYYGFGTAQFDLNELGSGNLVVGMAQESGTSVVDPLGNVLHSQCYAIDTFVALQSVKRYTDNEFVFVGAYWKDPCAVSGGKKFYPVVGRMDSLGNILTAKHYVLNTPLCTNQGGELEITRGNDVIAWGPQFFALRVDSMGVPKWAKRFGLNGTFQFIKELPGGDLLAGINMDSAGAVVARLDPDGNFLWCKSYIRPGGVIHDCVIESDDAFVITGYTETIEGGDLFITPPPPYHPKLFMLKLDGAGDVQWCRGYASQYSWIASSSGTRITHALDSNYVVLANIRTESAAYPFLMKTDLNGDTLWTRCSGRAGSLHDVINMVACSDGSYMYNGQAYGLGMYMFKTDSLGHLPCFERWLPVQLSDLFPTDSSFTLASSDGAFAFPAFLTDTIYDPLTVVEACGLMHVPPSARRTNRMTVRPNPNIGRFIVEFDDPLMADSYYSVYDIMGKLLYQRPIPAGATLEEVDLSRYGAGTFVIKFTDPEGTCYERVVVE